AMSSNNNTPSSKNMLLNWIRFHQCHSNLTNDYYMARLLDNIEQCSLQIPAFIMEEELLKEEKGNIESTILRECVIDLLKNICKDQR
ncbi:hypothetical protein PMAYCL1PPCAC_19991, partial [Pristionchus mayeri]